MKGHIRKRGKAWAIVFDLGRDGQGRRKQKWHSIKGTRRDAERELAKLVHAVDTGNYVPPTRVAVCQFLERWLRDYAAANVAPRTFERYQGIVRQHLSPAIGSIPLSKLQPLHIQEYYSRALQGGRCDGRAGLSPTTVLQHHRILREALKHAVRWQLMSRNPADAVEPPRATRKEMLALNEVETTRLLAAAKGHRVYIPVVLAVASGMRRGEILALRWSDLDLVSGTVSVRQSVQVTRSGLVFKQPKTRKSRRAIDLPSFAVEALRRHKVQQAKECLQLGHVFEDTSLVCPTGAGKPWNPDLFTHAFEAFLRRIDHAPLRFHDLRHGHATQLFRQGVHPKIVSERLGHSTVGLTLDTYSHVLPGMDQEAAQKLDVALRAANEALTDL